MLDAALRYITDFRWPVFPVEEHGKRPKTQNGFKDATLIEIHVKAWWKKWPRANIGIPTGPKTFDVLDVDGEAGLLSLADLGMGELYAPRQKTQSGGLQIIYKGGTLATNAKKLPGLDMRGGGGYVVVPPSIGVKGNYEWILEPRPGEEFPDPPGAILELVSSREPMAALPGKKVDVSDPTNRAILRMAGVKLVELRDGERNVQLFKIAASLRAKGAEAEEILHILSLANAVVCKPPKPGKEIATIAGSAARYAMSPAYQKHAEVIRQAEEKSNAAEEKANAAAEVLKARAARVAEKAAGVVAKANDQADELLEDAAVIQAIGMAGGDLDTLRSLIAEQTGLRIEQVYQVGTENPNYILDLGGGTTVPVGNSILDKGKLAEALMRARQHTGFADLSSKRWPAIRQALAALIVVTADVELTREGQTLVWVRDFYQSERRNHRLQRDEQTLMKRAPFIEGEWLYVNARGLRSHLLASGVVLTEQEVGTRLAEVGTRSGSGIVSAATGDGTIQARYWQVETKRLYLESVSSLLVSTKLHASKATKVSHL